MRNRLGDKYDVTVIVPTVCVVTQWLCCRAISEVNMDCTQSKSYVNIHL